MNIIDSIHYIFCGPIFISLLIGTGIFYTIYLKFPQIRFVPKSIKLLLGTDKTATNKSGETSAFQALATSLGGSIGVGCIAGTGMAINIGGPSSIFWMIFIALIGMALKYVEVLLCHKYRKLDNDGNILGAGMVFLNNELKLPILAGIMAVAVILSSIISGNMPQANSISKALYFVFGIKQYITGVIITFIIGFVIIGGIKRIGLVAEKLIPIMSLIFLLISIYTIVYNYKNLGISLKLIFLDPFNTSSALGGFIGSTFTLSILKGVNTGLYTSDAGSGASGIAHAASKEENSFNEGVYSIIEPFLSTAMMCTLTGLVVVSSGIWQKKFMNKFDHSDVIFLEGIYSEKSKEDVLKLKNHLTKKEKLPVFNDKLEVENGKILNGNVTIINSRSIAEDIKIFENNKPYNGKIDIINGLIPKQYSQFIFKGKSLLAGVLAPTQAFMMTPLGKMGPMLMNICLILFALTTVIAWYYYGDRGLVYLGATKNILKLYKAIFVILFFVGSLIDTSIIWKCSEIMYALMSIPNLIGIILLRKKVKQLTKEGVL